MSWSRSFACVFLSVAGFAVVSCADSPTDPGPGKRVVFELSSREYRSGESVPIVAVNLSSLTLEYPGSFCPMSLELFDQGTWVSVPPPGTGSGCPLSVGFLGPRDSVPFSFALPSNLAAGTYRILIPSPTTDISNSALAEPPLATQSITVSASGQ